jgi:epoxyqueuosine reductase QueG
MIGHLQLYKLVLQCGPYKSTATAEGSFQVGTALRPCIRSVLWCCWSKFSRLTVYGSFNCACSLHEIHIAWWFTIAL